MRYTKEERLRIGREIYTNEITVYDASVKYQLNWYTTRQYLREYRKINNLQPKGNSSKQEEVQILKTNTKPKYDDLKEMSREELINEVIKARVEEERAKKGYKVKGGGAKKEFITLDDVNLK